ncbi:FluG domain-containing protein [Colletotrichum truncatum]|uniref:FluG domain-containing protein n=1 Tax=Colletotrichum truncatum TaxID=5467 RepID=A0ACC3YEM5_COLTU|nr:FluG domain-containing protein [Colletotrichum truncatum]KAF6783286.1 FluG domain-containing protein [Colletotrichum truncatum]
MPRERHLDCQTVDANASTQFIKQFTEHETNERRKRRAPSFSAEEHDAIRKKLKTVPFINPNYAHETKINVSVVRKKWERYCREQHEVECEKQKRGECDELVWGDWQAALTTVARETMMDFFLRLCEWSKGKIKSWGTTQVYIRHFQQLYTQLAGRYVDRNDIKELYIFHDRVLVPRFGLRAPNINGKPVVAVQGLEILLVFNIAYDVGIFRSEGQRIQLAGCYQLLCYTGARPAELVHAEREKPKHEAWDLFNWDEDAQGEDSLLLDKLLRQETADRGRPKALCYEDILMMIVRHPVTGRAIPAMAIKFIYHKGADRKPKPLIISRTIFYFTPARKLLFCAVSTIIALALRDQAFEAASLTDAKAVLGLKIRGPVKSMALRWKKSMLKIPLFRKFEGNNLSKDMAMTYATLRDHMHRQSLDAGFEKPWTPRSARRGAANAANENAPESIRDQVMRHDPKFFTFHGSYLNENVNFDLQNAFLEENAEGQLYQLFTHVSLTRDPRATRDMVPEEVWKNMPPDPEIMDLERQRRELKGGQYRIQGMENEAKIRQLTEKINTKRDQRDKKVVKAYRSYYFYNCSTWDIEKQALGIEDEEYTEPAISLEIIERDKLAKILFYQPANCTDDEREKFQIEGIDLMVALFGKRETVRRNRIHADSQIPQPHVQKQCQPKPIPLILDRNQCPDCVGDERLSMEERTFKYSRSTVRNDHFDDQHLRERESAVRRGDDIQCHHPQCKYEKLKTLDAFRSHVKIKHGVSLRTSYQVMRRRTKKLRRIQMAREGLSEGKPNG